jgi:ribosomal protein S18 acetylase RimI-like enzyme
MPARILDLTLRPWRAEDASFVVALAGSAFAAYSGDPSGTMLSILGEPGTEVFVAELGSLHAGFVVLRYERLGRDFGPLSRPWVARINAIAVSPEARRRGIGRALLARAEEAARARGARSLSLATGEANGRARRLFEATGFFPLARFERYYAGGQAAVWMLKALVETR